MQNPPPEGPNPDGSENPGAPGGQHPPVPWTSGNYPQSPQPPPGPPGGLPPGGPPPGAGLQYQPPGWQPGVAPPPVMAPALPNAPGAVAALILGIISVVTCGLPTGPFAIWQGLSAEKAVKQAPGRYEGKGMATAGWILGIIGTIFLVGWIVYVLFWVIIFGAAATSSS